MSHPKKFHFNFLTQETFGSINSCNKAFLVRRRWHTDRGVVASQSSHIPPPLSRRSVISKKKRHTSQVTSPAPPPSAHPKPTKTPNKIPPVRCSLWLPPFCLGCASPPLNLLLDCVPAALSPPSFTGCSVFLLRVTGLKRSVLP